MKVILLEKVKNLGDLGSEVKVKAGFGRNYLIPYGKAVSATAENHAFFEEKRATLEKAAKEALKEAQARAAKLADLTITLSAKVGEEGKLFGSIGTRDIAEAVSKTGVAIAKSEVAMPAGPIRVLGEYDLDIQLHSDVVQVIKVVVVAAEEK